MATDTSAKDPAALRWRSPAQTQQFSRLRALLDLPTASYFIILVATLALTGFGLVMVLSASSIEAYDGGEGSSFSVFGRQAAFAVAGLVVLWVFSRFSTTLWRRLAWPVLILGISLQVLPFIPGLGAEVNGSTSWIRIGGFQAQPAEAGKFALALWMGVVLGTKQRLLGQWKHVLIPAGPVLLAMVGIILAGRDLGTALIVMLLALGALFISGIPMRMIVTFVAIIGLACTLLVVTSANRMARIMAMFGSPHTATEEDALGQYWQSNHGLFALASGGWTGVGLGASREKWSWLPEAHNDFIFAIIGEELGLVGSVIVIALFALLGYGFIRVIMRSDDMFVKITTAAVFAWIIGQATVNVGVVITVLPVIGVPMPMVSYGGSALMAVLAGIGLVLSFARGEPGAKEAMAARAAKLRRSLAVFERSRSTKVKGT